MDITEQFNQSVSSWTAQTRRQIKNKVLQLVVSKGAGYSQQKTTVSKQYGEANRIRFSFPYYMVFVHKGAGRGYGGASTKNERVRNLMGKGKRKEKPWFNPVIEARFPELSAILASYKGSAVVLEMKKILIK